MFRLLFYAANIYINEYSLYCKVVIFFKIFLSPILKSAEEVRRKRRRSGAYCGGAGMPLGFPCERGSSAAAITGRRRVRHAWGGGMMRLSSVWMGAGGSGVLAFVAGSVAVRRRCGGVHFAGVRAVPPAVGGLHPEAGRIVFSRDYALWISRLQSGGADPSAPEIERASGRNDPSRAKCRTPCAALFCSNAFRGGIRFRCAGAVRPSRRAAPASGHWFFFCFRRPKIELIAEKFVLFAKLERKVGRRASPADPLCRTVRRRMEPTIKNY